MQVKKVLITGTSGLVGGLIHRYLRCFPERYELYTLDKSVIPSNRAPADWEHLSLPAAAGPVRTGQEGAAGRFWPVDITDFPALLQAVQGMDVVVHTAATADPASGWESIHAANVLGVRNVFEACCRARVGRVIFTSSIKVVHGYMEDEPYKAIREGRYADVPRPLPLVTHDMPPRPLDYYAVSKIWGEGLARMYAATSDLSCLCLQLGYMNSEDSPLKTENITIWVSWQDLLRCIEACLQAPLSLRFDTFFVVSESRFRWLDLEYGRRVIGYWPRDWAEDFMGKAAAAGSEP